MSQKQFAFALVSGRFRRIVEIESLGEVCHITVVVGYRRKVAVASVNPGIGWKVDPSRKNGWVKDVPQLQEVELSEEALFIDYPVGIKDDPISTAEVRAIVDAAVRNAVKRGGPTAVRVVPPLRLETVTSNICAVGVKLPTEDEFKALVLECWTPLSVHAKRPAKKRGVDASSITGRGKSTRG